MTTGHLSLIRESLRKRKPVNALVMGFFAIATNVSSNRFSALKAPKTGETRLLGDIQQVGTFLKSGPYEGPVAQRDMPPALLP
jgi:hypothetical protein